VVFVGLDVHKRVVQACVVDGAGVVVREARLHGSERILLAFLKTVGECKVALEATSGFELYYDALVSNGFSVSVANPFKVRLIAQNRFKTDRADALALAQLLRTGFLPTSYVPCGEVKELRRLVRERIHLVGLRARTKNRVRYLLQAYKQETKFDPFTKKGMKELTAMPLPSMQRCVRLYDSLSAEIVDVEKELEGHESQHARELELLKSIPGIGRFTSLVIIAEVDDITRFPSAKKLCAYAGLVPSVRQSANTIKTGGITHQGSKDMRWMLVEVAHGAVRRDVFLKQFFTRIKARRGYKRAIVAVARKLLSYAFHVLSQKKSYDEIVAQDRDKKKHAHDSGGEGKGFSVPPAEQNSCSPQGDWIEPLPDNRLNAARYTRHANA